ncbi:MAG: DUF4105 domain-containing protein [Nitrospiraceae bacterium]
MFRYHLRLAVRCFFCCLLILLSRIAAATVHDPSGYLSELIQTADREALADRREWRQLLHYYPRLFGGMKSQQDDEGFFLSRKGKTSPRIELEATLAAFFRDDLVGRSRQPAQCAFMARYTWLKQQLAFDERRLPPQRCERFENWFKELNAEGISLIFPAGFMNNPASMFGHTFLRIDQRGQTEQTRILAYTINFAAEIPPDAGPEYAYKGIFGGYPGRYSTIPYYLKVQEYRDIENRDIWEYRLNLSEEQIRRLLMHAWEMGNATFDYYFFDENCAYHILSLLDAADPSFHLTDGFPFYTLPSDTVRRVISHPGLVKDVVYRPSRRTLVGQKQRAMSPDERVLLGNLVEDPQVLQTDAFAARTPERQAFLMDTASDYLLMRGGGDPQRSSVFKDRNRAILLARSRLKVLPEEPPIVPFTDRPDRGHGTARVGVGAGWRNNDAYTELAFRGVYHDLLDPEPGYTPDAQIELVSVGLRYYHNQDQTRLERFGVMNVVSLSPMDNLFKAPSWKMNLGMNTIKYNTCDLCSNGVAGGGIGAAFETRWFKREVYFGFAEVEANYSRAYDDRYRIGGGGTLGVLADLTERWKLLVSSTYLTFPLGDRSDDWRWSVGQRYTISQNLALRLEYHHRDHDNDVEFLLHAYF